MHAAEAPWLTIVGVIGDVHHSALTDDPDPEVHVPLAQAPAAMMMLAVGVEDVPKTSRRPSERKFRRLIRRSPCITSRTLEALVATRC